jgi:hypothetical protein
MFHMHTSFDLAPEVDIDDYRKVLEQFSAEMQAKDLVVATGPVMDTDEDRGHKYFFVMTCTDRQQCDEAVRHIKSADPTSDPVHRAVYKDIIQPIFSCWVDPD